MVAGIGVLLKEGHIRLELHHVIEARLVGLFKVWVRDAGVAEVPRDEPDHVLGQSRRRQPGEESSQLLLLRLTIVDWVLPALEGLEYLEGQLY